MKWISLIIILLPLNTLAVDWISISKVDSYGEFFIDRDSIEIEGNIIKFWVKANYKKTVTIYLDKNVTYNGTKTLKIINCKDKTYDNLSYHYYLNEENVHHSQFNDPDFTHSPPDELHGKLINLLCKKYYNKQDK